MKKIISIYFVQLSCWIFAQNPIFPGFKLSVTSDEAKGYYFFAPVKIGAKGVGTLPINIMLDEKGDIVYYKKFSRGPFAGSFRLQNIGLISYYFDNKFFIMDSTFTIVDSITCKNGVQQEPREFIILPNGHFVLLGSETVTMNLKNFKVFNKNNSPGSLEAKVKFDVIQELDGNKKVVFEWHSKNYFKVEDVDTAFISNPVDVDLQHSNSIDYDTNGDYYLSVRNFNEITKISRQDGHLIWRLGGKKNQFKFVNDSDMFKGQHGMDVLANGNILLFDNGRSGKFMHPEGGKEYQLDENKQTATLVWSVINDKTQCSSGYGNTQRLANGNTLVNYGRCDKSTTIFNVVNPNGKKIFEINTNDSLRNYRAYYYPQLPWPINRPEIKCIKENGQLFLEASSGFNKYQWSTGATTQRIVITNKGNYFVCVPKGSDGNICSSAIDIDGSLKPSSNNKIK